MGELLPGWRQQDLLGAARPGLLKKEGEKKELEGKQRFKGQKKEKQSAAMCHSAARLPKMMVFFSVSFFVHTASN